MTAKDVTGNLGNVSLRHAAADICDTELYGRKCDQHFQNEFALEEHPIFHSFLQMECFHERKFTYFGLQVSLGWEPKRLSGSVPLVRAI